MQANLKFFIQSDRHELQGWKYFWAKNVKGFNPAVHCARCLVGTYEKKIGTRSPVNAEVELDSYAIGDLLYICGVAQPSRWANNLHLACRVTGSMQDVASAPMFSGDVIMVRGAVKVAFDDQAAVTQFSGRGRNFLTCRNFQFGAALDGINLAQPQFACS